MKKLLALLIALLMLCGSAVAEIDWASMTDEEIEAAIDAAQSELDARKPATAEDGPIKIEDGLVLLDTDGVKVTVNGEPRLSDYFIKVPILVENNSDIEIFFENTDCTVNGWVALGLCFLSLDAGLKTKEDLTIAADDADISKLEDIDVFFMTLELKDYKSMDLIYTTGKQQYTFK